jgi:hypothetical protein
MLELKSDKVPKPSGFKAKHERRLQDCVEHFKLQHYTCEEEAVSEHIWELQKPSLGQQLAC